MTTAIISYDSIRQLPFCIIGHRHHGLTMHFGRLHARLISPVFMRTSNDAHGLHFKSRNTELFHDARLHFSPPDGRSPHALDITHFRCQLFKVLMLLRAFSLPHRYRVICGEDISPIGFILTPARRRSLMASRDRLRVQIFHAADVSDA